MIRFRPPHRALLAAALGLALSAGAAAAADGFDLKHMTPQQKADFGRAVRAYLFEHPEVLVEAIDKLQARQAEAQAADDAALIKANAKAIFDDPTSWVGGNPDGDVTLVEFMDYRCGYCRKALPDITRLLKADGKVRFIVKELPILTPDSVVGARYALAVRQVAGDAAYAKAHDALMVLTGPINDAALTRLSGKIGVDFDAVKTAMAGPEVAHILARNSALADRLQINGTPTFVLGDQLLRGYVPYAQLRGLIAQTRREDG
ncbi:hypothetical protein U879_12460 [Defluviimonas sp. 20V17]|uniref:DSBA oxidoreductase n=1 Tax=Allgaiera indica TaxID=765699 RepID=A0AAN4ZZL5_9RHOB|nr:DsbA family protein [Allgaiera indica]KDB03323.1 hypothetical protein U879_12460 [Defluviimonas sp. 20V17]GHE00420.1 DSBA oxidoreductase [Allgaiera indica]SDW62205.1 Protein-disulfide isomerase [Allgaiera indica]